MKLKGWKNIFSFTFTQQVKTKSFIISTIIISVIVALIAVSANILPVFILEDEFKKLESAANGEITEISISKLYIANKTEVASDISSVGEGLGITVESISADSSDSKIKELETSSAAEMLAVIEKTEGVFNISAYYAGMNEKISKDDCSAILESVSSKFEFDYYLGLGVPEEEIPAVMSGISSSVIKAGETPGSLVQNVLNTTVPMISSLVLFIFIFAYSQLIAQSIAIEKSSRVMEYLLTSISPLSIIVGKVLAICLVSLMQFLIIIMSGVLGFIVSIPFGIFSKIGVITQTVTNAAEGSANEIQGIISEIQSAFSTVNIGTILVLIVTFILGFLLYALIAGLAGASISKMEDLSAAIQPMSLIGVLGFYLAYMPLIGAMDGETNSFMILSRYLPISSPFCIPSAYMLGQMSLIETIIAIALLVVVDILLCIIVAKIYEFMVLYTGDRLKIKDMLNLAKNNK